MIVGQYIHKGGGTPIHSQSFARGGLGLICTASGLQVLGSPTVTITVEHKNFEDTTWSSLGGFLVIA